MSGKDHLIKHGTIMLVAGVLTGGLNWGFQIVMVRMLGIENFGTLFPLIGLFMIVSLPAGALQAVIAKYISTFRVRHEMNKMSYLIIRSFKKLAFLLGILLFFYLLFSEQIAKYQQLSTAIPVILMGPVLCLGVLMPVNFGALQGLERFTGLGLVQVIGALFKIFFGVLLVSIGFGVNGALMGLLLAYVAVLGISFFYLRDICAIRPFDENIGKFDIYRYFKPVIVAYTCIGLVSYIDAFIVKRYFDQLYAGYYSGVAMIGKAFLFAPMAFTSVMFPKVVKDREQGKDTLHLLHKTLIYSGIICLVGILVCVLCPRLLINILMSKKDITENALSVMVPLLRFVGFAITPYGFACIMINYYLACHWTRFLPFLVFGTILYFVLIFLFHNTLIQVLTVLLVAGILILSCGLQARLFEKLRGKR